MGGCQSKSQKRVKTQGKEKNVSIFCDRGSLNASPERAELHVSVSYSEDWKVWSVDLDQ